MGREKNQVLKLLAEVQREGMDDLVEWLKTSGYFISPASINFHNNFEGGLSKHSLEVTKMFIKRVKEIETTLTRESAIVCGLLHDVCKVGYYVKNENGLWVHDKTHAANKAHGALSVAIVKRFIELSPEEEAVILYHMGLFSVYGFTKEYSAWDLHKAVSKWVSVQSFAACDNEEAHKIKE